MVSIMRRTLLTVATTIIQTNDAAKIQIQRNCLSVLNSFYPYIRTVLFDNHALTAQWNLPNIIVVSTVRFLRFSLSTVV